MYNWLYYDVILDTFHVFSFMVHFMVPSHNLRIILHGSTDSILVVWTFWRGCCKIYHTVCITYWTTCWVNSLAILKPIWLLDYFYYSSELTKIERFGSDKRILDFKNTPSTLLPVYFRYHFILSTNGRFQCSIFVITAV